MNTEITEINESNLVEVKKRKRSKKSQIKPQIKSVVSSKRYVVAVKVFVTVEEKNELEMRLQKEGLKSLSNLIRQHLGLSLNETGRRKQIPKGFLEINDAEIEDLLKSSLG